MSMPRLSSVRVTAILLVPGSCGGAMSTIGASAVMTQRVTIGDNVVAEAGSVVSEDISGHVVVSHNPARVIAENPDSA